MLNQGFRISLWQNLWALLICSLLSSLQNAGANELSSLLTEFQEKQNESKLLALYDLAEIIGSKLAPIGNDKTGFWQDYANIAPFVGDLQGGMFAFSQTAFKSPAEDGPLIASFLDEYAPVDAVKYVSQNCSSFQFVMLGEEHMDSQTRCLLLPLLRELRSRGFKYFAAETFNSPLDETVRLGYTIRDTGYYTRDPIFAEAVNEAIKLGYILVPYESKDEPVELKEASPIRKTNYREMTQAKNLQNLILKKDPRAKVLVWAGRGHVYTEMPDTTKSAEDETWQPMAYLFHKLTGIRPLSLILRELEMYSPEKESSKYKYAAAKGWLKHPTVFLKNGQAFEECGAAVVFFPRQKIEGGRPDWFQSELNRAAVEIPRDALFQKGNQLAQVFETGRTKEAMPLDCILVKKNEPVPLLMVPKNGHFLLRITNSQGESKEIPVKRSN